MSCNTVTLSHQALRSFVTAGAICVDATAGRGRDTVLLGELVGETGKVYAFDIQPDAVRQTQERVQAAGFADRTQVLLDSHAHMEQYLKPNTVQAIVFNFGYLPGGDHTIYTQPESSIAAISAGLRLLQAGGRMVLSIYYGKDTGYTERDALLAYLKTIDDKQFTVLITEFANRKNDPPISVWILKDE